MTASRQSDSVDQGSARDADYASSGVIEAENPQLFSTFQPPSFEPVQYIPKKARGRILNSAVFETNVVAHEPLANGGNHWTFYLTVAPEPLSPDERRLVQLDSTPSGTPAGGGGSGSKANIVLSLLEDRTFSRAQCIRRLSTRTSITVGDFIDTITRHGRDKYDFDEMGRGCKKWVADQMDLFLEGGIFLRDGEIRDAKEDMMFQWDKFQRVGDHSQWAAGVYYE